jgi:hypothetical protein
VRSNKASTRRGESRWFKSKALAAPPTITVVGRMIGGVEDHISHGVRLVDRGHAHWLDARFGASLIEEGSTKGVFIVPGITLTTLIGHSSSMSSRR